jgi:hypothetical protein
VTSAAIRKDDNYILTWREKCRWWQKRQKYEWDWIMGVIRPRYYRRGWETKRWAVGCLCWRRGRNKGNPDDISRVFSGSKSAATTSDVARMSNYKGKILGNPYGGRETLQVDCDYRLCQVNEWGPWWLQGSEAISAYPCSVVVASERGLEECYYQRSEMKV